MGRNGFSLPEVVIVIALLGIIIGAGAGSVQGLAPKYHLEKAVWEARARLSQARINSIWEGVPYRVRFAAEGYFLEIYDEPTKTWVIRRSGPLEGVSIDANNTPIFHPTGTVSNLATILLSNSRGRYKITLAISGRVKISKG
jgi:prepilin-type N-terminal cleavage/methylation domain-containing protein